MSHGDGFHTWTTELMGLLRRAVGEGPDKTFSSPQSLIWVPICLYTPLCSSGHGQMDLCWADGLCDGLAVVQQCIIWASIILPVSLSALLSV